MRNSEDALKEPVPESQIDVSAIEHKPIRVSVDGVDLPFKIGDTIQITKNGTIRTVLRLQIHEDGHASYMLEWFDGNGFKTEWVTATELYYIWKNHMRNGVIGF